MFYILSFMDFLSPFGCSLLERIPLFLLPLLASICFPARTGRFIDLIGRLFLYATVLFIV